VAEGKPVIGITAGTRPNPKTGDEFGRLTLNMEYVEQVARWGGVPVVLPPESDAGALIPLVDGLLLTGGNDISASEYGEEPHPQNSQEDPRRFALERDLWARVHPRMPVLGICYGCQFLNIVHGGSLVQHLPDVLGDDRHSGDPIQEYRVEPGSKLGAVVGLRATGKSSHHQAVGRLGEGLRVTARHEDGTVEGLERTDERWVVGVQWHPERSHTESTDQIFKAFLQEAAAFRREKDTCGTW